MKQSMKPSVFFAILFCVISLFGCTSSQSIKNDAKSFDRQRQGDNKLSPCVKLFNKLEFNIENAEYYYDRGFSLIKTGQFDKAIIDCIMAKKLDAKNSFVYDNRCLGYLTNGGFDQPCLKLKNASESDGCQLY